MGDEPPKVMVSLPIDAGVLAWFQNTGPDDWQRRINDLLRFYMETSLQIELDHKTEDSTDVILAPLPKAC